MFPTQVLLHYYQKETSLTRTVLDYLLTEAISFLLGTVALRFNRVPKDCGIAALLHQRDCYILTGKALLLNRSSRAYFELTSTQYPKPGIKRGILRSEQIR